MSGFVFRLEPLLKVRRRAEEERQREVADLERERGAIEDALRRRQRALSNAKQDLRGRLVGTLDAQALKLYAGAALQDMRQAQRIVLELAAIHKRLESARGVLAEAAAARRALEHLRDTRRQEWLERHEKAERDALDDLATNLAKNRGPNRAAPRPETET